MPNSRDYLLEEDLANAWHFQREAAFRNKLKTIWSTTDEHLTILNAGVVPIRPRLREMFNKPTAFYFEQSAQCGRYDDVHGYPEAQRAFMAAMHEAWRARCGDMLDIEYGHFLANPVRITKQGPRSLSEIAAAHQTMCNMAKESGFGDENQEILVSYPAMVLICDRKVEGDVRDDDGYINLRRIAEQVTVLVMLTGAALEDQITLDDLEPRALPLERTEADGIDVRRVPLSVAVDFIMDLEDQTRRPRNRTTHIFDSSLCQVAIPKGFDRTIGNDPHTWVAAMMASEAREGPDCPRDIREASQRIEARVAGTPCDFDFEHVDWDHRSKPGYGDESRGLSYLYP